MKDLVVHYVGRNNEFSVCCLENGRTNTWTGTTDVHKVTCPKCKERILEGFRKKSEPIQEELSENPSEIDDTSRSIIRHLATKLRAKLKEYFTNPLNEAELRTVHLEVLQKLQHDLSGVIAPFVVPYECSDEILAIIERTKLEGEV